MIRKLSFFVVFAIIISCSSDSGGSDEPTTIQLVQITADNNNLISGAKDISLNPILRFTFSSNINIKISMIGFEDTTLSASEQMKKLMT